MKDDYKELRNPSSSDKQYQTMRTMVESKSMKDLDDRKSKHKLGKTPLELQLKKRMITKLKTTSIPEIKFTRKGKSDIKFSDIYDYLGVKGCGTFGFVVSAVDKESRKRMALKIVDKTDPLTHHHVEFLKKES